MRLFVTGGTGFIGKHLVRKLQDDGHTIFLLSRRPPVELMGLSTQAPPYVIEGDLSNLKEWKADVEGLELDAFIHLAWDGIPDYGPDMSFKNLSIGVDLYRLASEIGCKKILTTGSCWEYGSQSGSLNEDMAIRPLNSFSAAKNALNWIGSEIAKKNDIQFTWTRIFYVYGPGQKESSLIPYLVQKKNQGDTPELTNPGGANDFVYVGDVVSALALLLSRSNGGMYNIGSGRLTAVAEVVREIYGYESIQVPERPDGFYADISKIQKETGWEPLVSLAEGLRVAG